MVSCYRTLPCPWTWWLAPWGTVDQGQSDLQGSRFHDATLQHARAKESPEHRALSPALGQFGLPEAPQHTEDAVVEWARKNRADASVLFVVGDEHYVMDRNEAADLSWEVQGSISRMIPSLVLGIEAAPFLLTAIVTGPMNFPSSGMGDVHASAPPGS